MGASSQCFVRNFYTQEHNYSRTTIMRRVPYVMRLVWVTGWFTLRLRYLQRDFRGRTSVYVRCALRLKKQLSIEDLIQMAAFWQVKLKLGFF